MESLSLAESGTETLSVNDSNPATWNVSNETDQFTIQDSISNAHQLWRSWSDYESPYFFLRGITSATGTSSLGESDAYSMADGGTDTFSSSAWDYSDSYALSAWQASETAFEAAGTGPAGSYASDYDIETSYSLGAGGTDSDGLDGHSASTMSFAIQSTSTVDDDYPLSLSLGTPGGTTTIAQSIDSGTESESYSETGWSASSDGHTAIYSYGVTSGFLHVTSTETYTLSPGGVGTYLYHNDQVWDDTTTISGNDTAGYHTTGYGSGSGSSTMSGGFVLIADFPGGVAGLPEDGISGDLLNEVLHEQSATDQLDAFYESGSLYLYDSSVGTDYPYEVPTSAPAFLSGSTTGLADAPLAALITGSGSNSAFGFIPSTNGMTAHGLPAEKATALHNLAQNTGPDDGVSHTSTSQPTSVLVTLAAAGRNPTDITIPTQAGTEGSGGDDEEDAAAGGGSVAFAAMDDGSSTREATNKQPIKVG